MTPSAAMVLKMPPAAAELNAPDPDTPEGAFSAVSNSTLKNFEQIFMSSRDVNEFS